MPKHLIIDTETSGLFDFSKPADAEGQPRLCALAMLYTGDDSLDVIDEWHSLIKPSGWEITPEITAINGLTTERCEAEGIDLTEALSRYMDAIVAGHIVVAFNAQFDTKVLRGEMRRSGLDDLFEQTPNICTMRACKPLGIEKAGPKKGGFPKLSDAYRHFYKEEPADQHTALGDARACHAIFRKLVEINAASAAEVHFATNRPAATPVEETAA